MPTRVASTYPRVNAGWRLQVAAGQTRNPPSAEWRASRLQPPPPATGPALAGPEVGRPVRVGLAPCRRTGGADGSLDAHTCQPPRATTGFGIPLVSRLGWVAQGVLPAHPASQRETRRGTAVAAFPTRCPHQAENREGHASYGSASESKPMQTHARPHRRHVPSAPEAPTFGVGSNGDTSRRNTDGSCPPLPRSSDVTHRMVAPIESHTNAGVWPKPPTCTCPACLWSATRGCKAAFRGTATRS